MEETGQGGGPRHSHGEASLHPPPIIVYRCHGVQSGLLTPNERDRVESKAWKYKEKLPDKLLEKENVLKTATGRGLLLITISIIRHRYKYLNTKDIRYVDSIH